VVLLYAELSKEVQEPADPLLLAVDPERVHYAFDAICLQLHKLFVCLFASLQLSHVPRIEAHLAAVVAPLLD
jgi:hypothetical protein